MWRLSLRIFLVSVILYAVAADYEKIGRCPDKSVCAWFGNLKKDDESCHIKGGRFDDAKTAILWEHTCSFDHYNGETWAFLDIEPIDIHKWKFILTIWINTYPDRSKNHQYITTVGFDYDRAKLRFTETSVNFEWKDKLGEWHDSSNNTMEMVKEFDSDECEWKYVCHFKRYAFTIELEEEKLIEFFGTGTFNFTRTNDPNPYYQFQVALPAFGEKLIALSLCDPDEIKQSCPSGACDQFDLTNATSVNCPSNLWFHNSENAFWNKQWVQASKIECKGGYWKAFWDGDKPGEQRLMPSSEVQCSADRPAKMMGKLKTLVIGLSIGGAILVIALIVIAFLLIRKRNRNGDANRGTLRDESNASKNTERAPNDLLPPGISPTADSYRK